MQFHAKVGIVLTAYSPLGAGSYVALNMATEAENLLVDPVIVQVAKKHDKSPAQVCVGPCAV